MEHKNRRARECNRNSQGKGKENNAVKGQRQGEHRKKRTGSLLSTIRCNKSSGSTMLCHAMEWVNTGGCALPLPVQQTITSQQSEVPRHPRKCRLQFLAVLMKTHAPPCSRYGTLEQRSSAATVGHNTVMKALPPRVG